MSRAIARIAIVLAVVIIVLILCAGGWVISGSWVSPFEKRAIQVALTEIDGIRQYKGVDSEAYRSQIARAKAAVALCKRREITTYDGQIVWGVEMDLDGAINQKKFWQLPDTNPSKWHALEVDMKTARSMEAIIRAKIQ